MYLNIFNLTLISSRYRLSSSSVIGVYGSLLRFLDYYKPVGSVAPNYGSEGDCVRNFLVLL